MTRPRRRDAPCSKARESSATCEDVGFHRAEALNDDAHLVPQENSPGLASGPVRVFVGQRRREVFESTRKRRIA
jgi:hypothetical protein